MQQVRVVLVLPEKRLINIEYAKVQTSLTDYIGMHTKAHTRYFTSSSVWFFCFITNKNAKEKINPEDLPQNTLVIYPVHEDFSYILQTNIFKEEKEGSEEKIILYLESKKRRTYNN